MNRWERLYGPRTKSQEEGIKRRAREAKRDLEAKEKEDGFEVDENAEPNENTKHVVLDEIDEEELGWTDPVSDMLGAGSCGGTTSRRGEMRGTVRGRCM